TRRSAIHPFRFLIHASVSSSIECSRPVRSHFMNPLDQHAATTALAITIGRQPGSGGSELGRRVAARLGAAYLDQEILREAARQLGVQDQTLADREERVTRFWERVLRAFAIGAP